MRLSPAFILFVTLFYPAAALASFPQTKSVKSVAALVANKGQLADMNGSPANNVLYYANTPGLQFFITNKGMTFVFARDVKTTIEGAEHRAREMHRIDAELVGASISSLEAEEYAASTKALRHYFNPLQPQGLCNIPELDGIRIRNVYPGIDWVVRMTERGIKYDFDAAAGADVSRIRIRYTGADELFLRDGSLYARCMLGEIVEQPPLVVQGHNVIPSLFNLNRGDVTFQLGEYDAATPLHIDPEMVWGTFFGGNDTEQFLAVTTDKLGNTIVTGYTTSPNFPLFNAGFYYDNSFGAATDVVIVKFNAGMQLAWSTFYGGTTGTEHGCGVTTDNANNLYVVGFTGANDFPTHNGGGFYNPNSSGQTDGFVLKFNPSSALLHATYIGGSAGDRLWDLALDPSGNLFVIGNTTSADFTTMALPGAYFNPTNSGADGVVLKFTSNLSLVWSTFFGGSMTDELRTVSADASGNVFIGGYTESTDFPLVNGGGYYNGTLSGHDGVIAKFSPGLVLVWSTLYGGSGNDRIQHSAVDPSNNLFVSGYTRSVDFPVVATGQAFLDNTLNTGNTNKNDFFFAKFSNSGTQLWSTYFGGSDDDGGIVQSFINDGLVCDPCGNIYGSFVTNSNDVTTEHPGCNAYFDDNLSHGRDAFFVKFRKSLKLHWATYFGSAGWEDGFAITLDRENKLIAAGRCPEAFGMPVEQFGIGYFDNSPTNQDGFLAAFKQPEFNPALNYTLCNGPCTGTATVNVNSTCNVGYTYQWSTGASTNAVNGLCAGAYQVTITDTLHCRIDTLAFTMAPGIEANPIVNGVSCNLGCTGTAAIAVPGASGLTYQWSNGSTNASVMALCPGNYTVTVTAPGCGSDIASFSVMLPPALTILVNSVQNPNTGSCAGACNGGATVMLNGGATIPYAVWSNGETGTSVSNLCSGQTYQVTASDSLCFTTTVPVIMAPPPPLNITVGTTAGCGCQNTATVQILNGSGSQTFLWSNGATTQSITACSGIYTVTVTDSICGPAAQSFFLPTIPPPVISYIQTNVPACPPCTASAWVGLQLPTLATYQWSNGQTTPTATNLCVGETYFVTVTNTCGMSDTGSVFIEPPPPMRGSAGPVTYTCPGNCDGTATASASNATLPLAFQWSTGATTASVSGLCAGETYTVTITDYCGQTDTILFVFPFPFPLAAFATAAYPGCPGTCDAQATAAVYPGTGLPPYSYQWSNGATNVTAYSLCVDSTYMVTVTDYCGATFVASVTIPRAAAIDANAGQSPACDAACVGIANVYYTGGLPPYNFMWSNGETVFQITNGCPNTLYTVTVYDACGNSDTASVTIQLATPPLHTINVLPPLCNMPCNGSATLTTTGGTPPFIYSWSNGSTTASAASLCPGSTYTLTVIDPGCSIDSFIIITPPLSFNVLPGVTGNACLQDCDGIISLGITGGLPPYNIAWSTGSNAQTIGSLCVGTYVVTVFDSGCAADTLSIFVGGPSITINVMDTLDCLSDCGAAAQLVYVNGGAPYTVVWSNGATGLSVSGLCGGYQFVVVNDAGCYYDTIGFTVETRSNTITAALSSGGILCFAACTGNGTVIASGGIEPYTYAWTGGAAMQTTNTLCAGWQFVSVTDALGCVKTDSVFIQQPDNMIIDYETIPTTCQDPDGEIMVDVTGGTAPYTYTWSTAHTTSEISGLPPGTYHLTVTDSNNCSYFADLVLTSSSPPFTIISDTMIYAGSTLELWASGAVTYQWSPSIDLGCANCAVTPAYPGQTTTYCVTAIDIIGCEHRECVVVSVDHDCGGISSPNAFTPNGDGLNDVFRVAPWCIQSFRLTIYNRWGQKVFETADPEQGWNGTFNGRDAEVGVYAFTLESRDFLGRLKLRKGNVTLLR